MSDVAAVKQMLKAHGQEHLLRFYDELPPDGQKRLLDQIAAIDFKRLDGLIAKYVREAGPAAPLPSDIKPPATVSARPTDAAAVAERQSAEKRGLELIAAGKVAAFVVAGGQGTRLGYQGPKGCLEATPVAHKPLFRLFAEQIMAASKRARVSIPWFIMTSPENDVATKAHFRQNDFWGMSPKDVFFFAQGTMPSIGLDGKLLLAKQDSLALSPDGHGGSLTALRKNGALDEMARRGVEYLSYFQVDNPLVRCIDPVFLGLHDLRGAEMSAKALAKRDPMEKLGNFCLVNGKITVIEYSDMPDELARACTNDGRLKFSAGSIAIHVISRKFIERLTKSGQADLPYHRAQKKVPFIDDAGQLVKPEEPNAVKLEMFVFDAMPLAVNPVIMETVRSEEFSPVKNATGEDSLATSLHDQIRRWSGWLESAGIRVPRDAAGQFAAAVEISPLWADSAEELALKVDRGMTIKPGQSLYLGSKGQLVGGAA